MNSGGATPPPFSSSPRSRQASYHVGMNYRPLGRTGFEVSEISFGAWAIGGSWGAVDDGESLQALNKAIDRGVNFIDTADVYGDGRSERLIAQLKHSRRDNIIVATKAGRRLTPHNANGYNRENLTGFVERSLQNLRAESIDLLQLHCPPTDVYYRPEVFGVLDDLVASGKLRFYGVSVEKVEEGLKAIDFPNVQSVQIIFNLFRQRPMELFFPECVKRKVGVLARVPLASGLLSGKLKRDQQYAADDHRGFNQLGAAFDMGETFSGLGGNMEVAFDTVDRLRKYVPPTATLAQLALKWILMHPAVTCAIPGAKSPTQSEANVAAAELPELTDQDMAEIGRLYSQAIKPLVHDRW